MSDEPLDKETLEILSDPDTMALLAASEADIEAGRLHDHDAVGAELGLVRPRRKRTEAQLDAVIELIRRA